MGDYIEYKTFQEIDLSDHFFDSLKQDYQEFTTWFAKKDHEFAYVLYCDSTLSGFMYLKQENEAVTDIDPHLPTMPRIKIGTFKIDAHGTKLGERFIKKAIDHALSATAEQIYVTAFEKHSGLISLFEEYGFIRHGVKYSPNGEELVLVKTINNYTGKLRSSYPLMNTSGVSKFLLGIQPKWHTKLFPDSILNTESYDLLSDVSHTNSIQKTYIAKMRGMDQLRPHDLIIIYRTSDDKGPAEYRSVVTSVCTVEEVRSPRSFESRDEYIKFTLPFSVFNENELNYWYGHSDSYVIKMLYNAAFTKRIIRKDLIEQHDINRDAYAGFMKLTNQQFESIIQAGGIYERLIVN